MQSYKQYWQSLAVDHAECTKHNGPSKPTKRDPRPINPGAIPFDSSRLPVIARKRIRPPITPPHTPEPRLPAAIPRQSIIPIDDSFPAPSSLIPFYGTPQTPSFRSDPGSTPSGSTLLTPITPRQLYSIRFGSQTPNASPTPLKVWPAQRVEATTQVRSSRDDTPTPRMPLAQSRPIEQTSCEVVNYVEAQSPVSLHHVSSSGGLLAALRRYENALRIDTSLAGMSLFLNCPKKRVPFPSEFQLAKYRLVAEAWNKSQKTEGRNGMKTMVHAVHTSNLGSRDVHVRFRSFISLMSEMIYAQMLGIEVLVFHPGATGQEAQKDGSDVVALAEDLILLLQQVPGVTLAIENSTHRCRGQLGRSIPELEYLINRVGQRLKVCLDLCHLHVDQYDLSTIAGRQSLSSDLTRLGSGNIAAVHVSDSMEIHGGTRDLHAGLGRGTIGLDGLREVLRHSQLLGKVPFLLETPPSIASTGHHRHTTVQRLEEERCRVEHDILRLMLKMSDDEWKSSSIRETWWTGCQTRMKAIDRRIARLVGKIESKKDLDWGWTPAIEEIKRARRKKLRCTLSLSSRARSEHPSARSLHTASQSLAMVIERHGECTGFHKHT